MTSEVDESARHAENERILRDANRRIDDLTRDLADRGFAAEQEDAEFLCACGRPECDARLTLGVAEYEAVHREPHRFIVCPGHEDPAIERVVARHPGYVVVEKLRTYQRPDPAG